MVSQPPPPPAALLQMLINHAGQPFRHPGQANQSWLLPFRGPAGSSSGTYRGSIDGARLVQNQGYKPPTGSFFGGAGFGPGQPGGHGAPGTPGGGSFTPPTTVPHGGGNFVTFPGSNATKPPPFPGTGFSPGPSYGIFGSIGGGLLQLPRLSQPPRSV